MKAIVFRSYGSPEVLGLEEVEKPVPADDAVLVRVRAASVNPLDWHFMRGEPYLLRAVTGVRKPRSTRLGADLAGQVEAVGRQVARFRPGDEVFGAGRGAFAEYACVHEKKLAPKPTTLTLQEAAAVPVAALTALQAIRDKGRIQSGQTVLVNGAAGGVGTFAVQIAKAFGGEVTGVCSARNADLVRSLGADHVVDYNQEDFTRGSRRYDLILDAVGNRSLSDLSRVMGPRGICVGVGASGGGRWIDPVVGPIGALVWSWFHSQKVRPMLASVNDADLVALKDLIEAGKVGPVIDRSHTLSEVPEAIRYLEQGHARGKVVITVE